MRVIITGGRDYHFTPEDEAWLDTLDITYVHQGGAKGADQCAFDWAWARGICVETHMASWHVYGRGAGPIRNTRMLEALLADAAWGPIAVIAFAGGHGTQDMVQKAKDASVQVIERAQKPTPSPGASDEGVAALLRGSDTNPNSEASIAQQREETSPQT